MQRVYRVVNAAQSLRAGASDDSELLVSLQVGQAVARLDDDAGAGWWFVFADTPGAGVYVGYVNSAGLATIPMTDYETYDPADSEPVPADPPAETPPQESPPENSPPQTPPAPPSPPQPPAAPPPPIIAGPRPDNAWWKGDVLFLQRLLKASGLSPGPLDGDWGPKTASAYAMFLSESQKIRNELGSFSQRTENNLATLALPAQRAARTFLSALRDFPLRVEILSGTRSYAEQNQIYAQGRTAPGDVVTNAKGGESNHNFGIAWDIGLFDSSGRYLDGKRPGDEDAYRQAAGIAEDEGVEWGGHWRKPDSPHYQLAPKFNSSNELRVAFESGDPFTRDPAVLTA